MNLDSLSYTLAQISYLVSNLSKKNFKQSVQEIFDAIQLQGFEADRHLLRCLLSYIDFRDLEGPRNTSHKDYYQVQLLAQQCAILLNKPAITSILCFALDNPLHSNKAQKPSIQQFVQLSRILHLSPVQEVVFGLVCLESSNYSTFALQFVRQKLPLLIKTYINLDINTNQLANGGLHDSNPEILHLILSHVFNVDEQLFGISKEVKKVLLLNLRRDFPIEVVPILLVPLIYSDKPEQPMDRINSDTSNNFTHVMDNPSLPDLILEMGYSVCGSIEECRRNILSVTNGCVPSVTFGPESVAKVISMMIRTHTGLDSQIPYWPDNGDHDMDTVPTNTTTWNIEVFVNTIKELNPTLSWIDLIKELDHGNFYVKDRQGLVLLFMALRLGLNAQGYLIENFPIDLFYRQWANSEAQMSLIQHILQNSDVFCFADYPFRSVSIESLKTMPEADDKDINNWRSIELVELLLYLAECGLYYEVQECLKFPIKKCPDILALALMESNGPLNMIRHEIISSIIPIFLGNHNNAATILQHAWNHQNVGLKHTLVQAMSDWYMRSDSDHVKLSRILDIAQNLKALSLLLSVQQFPFIIDLACLASRRDYLKLDKWIADKIREQSEPFVTSCVQFLQKRYPQLSGSTTKDENHSKYTPLSSETILVLLNSLRNVTGTVSPELSETIIQMVSTYTNLCMPKGVPSRVNPMVLPPLPPIFRPMQPPRPMEGPALQVMVDQLAGLATSLANFGMNPTTQPNSIFTLPGSLGQLIQAPISPSQNLINNATALGGFSIMAPTLGPNISNPLSGPSMLNCLPPQMLPSVIGKSSQFNSNMVDFIDNSLFMDGNMPITVPQDIEDEANSYFQRIYNLAPHNSLSIDEILEMLKRFQESPIKREKEVFCCMLRNLFEEYRFFPAYPEKELITTAHLFGGIIEHNLVSNYKALGLALRFIFDALKKNPNTKMYNFGITALDRFKTRLKEYHQYCSHITSIPHFTQFPQHLIEYVEYGKNSQDPPNSRIPDIIGMNTNTVASGTFISSLHNIFKVQNMNPSITTSVSTSLKLVTTNTLVPFRPSIANTTNIDTLLVATEKDDKLILPPENLQDKVAFIFNNLSQINLQTKCDEIKEIVGHNYLPWLSQYLVMKRVSIEFNFHTLYSNFLECLNNDKLNALIIKETFRNIKILLVSEKGMDNFSDRSLLKNLGHWLGMITLARNRPILLDNIDLKMLLVEAFNNGHQELLFIVPFIAKILESCSKSKVFKPRNPWTMSVINCLAELHQEPEIKLTLKFEVEVLCKALNLKVEDLKPGYVLKNPEIAKTLKKQLSNENSIKPKTKTKKVPEQPKVKVSVPTSINHTPIFQTVMPPQEQQQNIMSTIQSINSNTLFNNELASNGAAGGANTLTSSESLNNITGGMSPTPNLFETKFNYVTLNTTTPAQIMSMIVINSQIPLFINQPALKTYVRSAIERSIQDWLNPVVDKSIKIAATTVEHIVKKDFGMDPDESHMRKAAHCMVRNLTSGLSMITCREQVVQVLMTNLKQHFLSALTAPTQAQKEMVDQACSMVANDNVELACAFVQKTATEKAINEVDKYLKNEYERRSVSRMEGRRFYDPMIMSGQAEYLPDTLRNKVGLPLPQMIGVYEEFARNIPGFEPLDRESVSLFMPKTATQLDEMSVIYEKLINEIEVLLQLYMNNQRLMSNNTTQVSNLHSSLELMVSLRRSRDVAVITNIITKIIENYLEGLSPAANQDLDMTIRFRDVHLNIIRAFQDPRAYNLQWTNKTLTKALVECREDLRFNLDAIDALIRAGMLNIGIYDMHLAMSMDNGSNYVSMAYIKQVLQHYLIDNRSNSPLTDINFQTTLDTLNTIMISGRPIPDGLPAIMEMVRPSHGPSGSINRTVGSNNTAGSSQFSLLHGRDFDDPPGLLEKTEYLLKEWLGIYNVAPNKDPSKTFSGFIQQMNVQGILKSDDIITRFFRISTQMMVELWYRQNPDQTLSPAAIRSKLFHTIDAYVKLVVLLIKHSGDTNALTTKTNLLNKVLGIIVGVLLQDHDAQTTDFHQLPYHRILITLFLDLNAPDPVLESINYSILTVFCHTFHLLRPRKVPGFTYAWLELISHRIFIGRLLGVNAQQKDRTQANDLQAWNYYAQLLVDLFKYLSPFLRNAELAKPVHILYKGTLRVLLILLHDFPEFLCEYHYGFCDVIPPNCIQMRNLILSAFPRNMRLPDPFTPNLKVDVLQEISVAPKICPDFQSFIQPVNFKKDLDLYLKTRSPVTFLSDIRTTMQQSCCEPGMRYNVSLLNAIVLYVGTQAIQLIRNKGLVPNISTITHSAHMDIFQNLSVDLDTEGRYLFLNSIANQLRYPNSHTHYFSCTLLYLFAEANSEIIQEQITRVLLERLIVNRPHPWGLLITFIELIKNPAYKFWNHEFVHCAPEIEKLFESVARSCMVPKQPPPTTNDGDLPTI